MIYSASPASLTWRNAKGATWIKLGDGRQILIDAGGSTRAIAPHL